jgi:subtilisin family serine protease
VIIDGSNRTKPDITAPGTNTRSASNTSDTAYTFASGTSMATPHIAGAMALLWSAHPELQNQIDASRTILDNTTTFISSTQCGAAGPPNNVYGWGRVDILAAVDSVMADTVAITKAQYAIERSQLTVLATDTNTAAVLTVSVTSTGEILGTMDTRNDGNYRLKANGIANPQNVTVTSNLGGSAAKSVKAR